MRKNYLQRLFVPPPVWEEGGTRVCGRTTCSGCSSRLPYGSRGELACAEELPAAVVRPASRMGVGGNSRVRKNYL